MPLWERAKKEQAKASKENDANAKSQSAKNWWNDEWIASAESSLGKYPIICRVEKTQANFPPDPYKDLKTMVDGKVVWKVPTGMTKSKVEKTAPMRLAVTLRPLTSVMPPKWTESGPIDDNPLVPPPPFTAVTFPSSLEPYLVPLSWAYIHNHSLSVGDELKITDSKGKQKGKVLEFSTIEGGYGSFRLEDKMSYVKNLVAQLSKRQASYSAVDNSATSGRSSSSTSISPQDVFAISEFLSKVQVSSDSHSENTEAKEPIEFVDFVRSTLPLWNGVSILRNVYDRKATWTQSWGLQAKKARSDKEASSLKFLLEDYLAEGFPRTLDNMLRVKIECSIEDLVRENQQLDIFLSPVTEDIAPSYSCAVPVSMCFERILQRLKNPTNAAEGKSKCYYRTFDAIMADLNVIQDNCSLYNDPESFVAHAANEVIPTTKKFLANVASRHVKERAEKIKAENEKRDFVMMNCNASALLESDETTTVPTSGTKLSKDNIFDPFKTPFKDHLFTDWVQLTNPDSSWRQDKKMSEPVLSWVPQVGDAVLYSRSLHASFVKGHYGSLNVSQCILPQFHRDDRAKEDEPGSSDLKHIKSQGMVTDEQLSEVLESGWILGTILWSKTDFPRPRTLTNPSGGDENGFFETEAPVLTLGLRFPGYELTLEKKPVIIHWRPCKFSSGIESPESECCGSCDVPIKTSFLRPAWLNGHREGNVTQPPSGLLKEDSSAIERCFNLLKRRCLNNVPADHMDANLTNKKVKGGYIPQMVKVGSKSLPEYHEILKVDYESPKNSKTISTRGIRREPDAEMSQLARFNFLPPWLPESSLANGSEQETQAVLLHDTLSPCPRLCLELVLVRLKNGYYRQKAAIHNDLVEAYVTSVLLALAPYAKRKKSAISIKRLVSALSSKKSPVLPSLSKQLSESKKSVVPVNANMPGSNSNSPSMKGSTSPAGPTKKAKTTETISSSSKSRPEDPSNIIRERCENGNAKQGVNNKAEAEKNNTAKSASSVFTEEETALLERLEAIRRLYASAIVCISDTTHVQNLFGLSSLQVPRQIIQQNVMTVSPDQAPAVMARETLEQLLVALGRDSRVNRQRHSGSLPSVKVKFKCVQEIVKTEAVVQIRVSVPPVSCVGRSDGGESSAAFEKPAPTTSDVNRKSGGAPPSAVEQAQAPVDESLSQATVGSKGESNLPLPLVQDQALEAPKTSNVRMVLDCVDFKPEDYENDFTLSRLFFGKPGRMDRCIRCAARHRTMLTCRVRKGHSNIDFDLVGTFKGAGGLDGLFNILFQRPNASEAVIPMAPQSNQEGMKEGQSSAPEEIGQNNDTTDDALKKVDKQDHQQDNNVATAPTAPPSAENNNDKENEVTEKGQDPRLLFEKAKAAHELAKEVLGSAKVYAEAPLRLSDEFIACNFPFDTADGHYSFCIICGLSGDLLCCDGCANVAHPACANLSAIPEGDWFCSEHCGKKKLSCLRSPPQDTSMKSASTASNSSETEKAQPTTLNANKNDGLVANGVGVQGKKENFAAEEGDAGGQDETSNENAGHADAPTTFSEIPPAVTFDRKKLETLKAQLEELSKLRLRRPSKQRENNQDAENESSGMPGAVNEERASGDTKWPGKDGAADDKQPTSIGVGTKFVKRFGRHGFFKGELVSEPNDTHPFYRAKYEDGDEEDLEEFEVLDYLKRWGQKIGKTQKKGSAKEENSQKKQDKPSKTKHDADQQPARGNGVAEASKTDDKRPRGRPRKPPVEGETEKRPRGRPRKRPLEEVDVTESEKEASDPIKKAKVSEAPTVAPKAQVVQPLSSASKAGDTDAFSNNKSNAADNPSGATSTGGRRRK